MDLAGTGGDAFDVASLDERHAGNAAPGRVGATARAPTRPMPVFLKN